MSKLLEPSASRALNISRCVCGAGHAILVLLVLCADGLDLLRGQLARIVTIQALEDRSEFVASFRFPLRHRGGGILPKAIAGLIDVQFLEPIASRALNMTVLLALCADGLDLLGGRIA